MVMNKVYVLIDEDSHRDDILTAFESKEDAMFQAHALIKKWTKIYGEPDFEINKDDWQCKSWVDGRYRISVKTVVFIKEWTVQ